jgi:hypothetical protein
MRRLVAIGVLSALFLATAAASPALACGCGVVVAPDGSSVEASNERALVYWDGKKESIDLLLDVESDGLSLGMIIPTPLPALVSEGDPRLFDLVENTVEPTSRVETDYWGLGYLLPDVPVADVVVKNRVVIGDIETRTIEATDPNGLTTWLAANGYSITEAVSKSLANYVERGWSFTVFRMVGEGPISGELDPIRLTFDTPLLVYPARIAATESSPQSLRVYVFDKQRVSVAKAHAPTIDIEADVTVAWAGELVDERLTDLGPYLTVFDIRYNDPKEQATSDLGFVYSVSDSNVQPEIVHYRMVTLLGIPVGTLIVTWVLIGLVLTTGHFVGRRRAR